MQSVSCFCCVKTEMQKFFNCQDSNEEPERKQSKNVTFKILKMANFGNKISHQTENHS